MHLVESAIGLPVALWNNFLSSKFSPTLVTFISFISICVCFRCVCVHNIISQYEIPISSKLHSVSHNHFTTGEWGMDDFQHSRHGKRYLSSEIFKQFRKELELVELLDDALFLVGGIKSTQCRVWYLTHSTEVSAINTGSKRETQVYQWGVQRPRLLPEEGKDSSQWWRWGICPEIFLQDSAAHTLAYRPQTPDDGETCVTESNAALYMQRKVFVTDANLTYKKSALTDFFLVPNIWLKMALAWKAFRTMKNGLPWFSFPQLLQAETRAICYDAVFLFLSSVLLMTAPLLLNYLAVNQDMVWPGQTISWQTKDVFLIRGHTKGS